MVWLERDCPDWVNLILCFFIVSEAASWHLGFRFRALWWSLDAITRQLVHYWLLAVWLKRSLVVLGLKPLPATNCANVVHTVTHLILVLILVCVDIVFLLLTSLKFSLHWTIRWMGSCRLVDILPWPTLAMQNRRAARVVERCNRIIQWLRKHCEFNSSTHLRVFWGLGRALDIWLVV